MLSTRTFSPLQRGRAARSASPIGRSLKEGGRGSVTPDFRGNLRLGVVCDLVEENWPSMDLIGDMLIAHLSSDLSGGIEAGRIRPSMSRRFSKPDGANSKAGFNADRLLNRFWDYPRFLRRCRAGFDLFHLVDHSYAQLVLELPSRRTVVTCHDIDTFRCLVEPEQERRSTLFQAMVRRTLRGLRMAELVVCPSFATRDALLAHDLVPEGRLRVVPLGAHPSCSIHPDPSADSEAMRLLGADPDGHTDLLHVASTIPRKRVDVTLKVFAEVRTRFPNTRLIRVGGPFTPAQESLVDELRLRDSIIVLPHLDRRVLAAVYRRTAIVLLTSEREGFGLPVLEAMACGTPVVASDLPVLREVGGSSTVYCGVGEVPQWADAISRLLIERRDDTTRWRARRDHAVTQASHFTWNRYTLEMMKIYREVASGIAGRVAS
jgi:glycosyltransferase involved in cell wall biosynthesis